MINIFNPVISKVEGGGKFNIHYGLNPPEDTSMLWVKRENKPTQFTAACNALRLTQGHEILPSILPVSLFRACAEADGSNIYIIGGGFYSSAVSGNEYYNTITTFDTKEETCVFWNELLPQPLGFAGSAKVGRAIYMLGGCIKSKTTLSSNVYKFDIETNTVTTLASASIGYNNAVVAVGTKVYSFGGQTGTTEFHNKIYIYDTENNKITQSSATLPTNMAESGIWADGNKIYIIGGSISNRGDYYTSVIAYDVETEEITTVATNINQQIGNSPLSELHMFTIGSELYLFAGGYTSADTKLFKVEDLDTFNLSDTGEIFDSYSMYYEAVASVGKTVYFFGGGGSGLTRIRKISYEDISTLPTDNAYLELTLDKNLFPLVNGNDVVTVGVNKLYVGNANNEPELQEVYHYNETSQAWELI